MRQSRHHVASQIVARLRPITVNATLSFRRYSSGMIGKIRTAPHGILRRFAARALAVLALALASLLFAAPARAANCNVATSQGTTGPVNWNTYCWIDFTSYNDTTARSASGQNFSLTLQDGTTVAFNLKVSGVALAGVASPSWGGAAVGNTAFVGIAGKPILYSTAGGTTNVTISNIVLTPPLGGTSATAYMFVAADGESTNCGESLAFTTNGGNWTQLDTAGATDGSATMPGITGVGTTSVTETGSSCGLTGGYILGTTSPTTLTSTIVGGGLQGVMFAVRFASIRLNTVISGARAAAADQFAFAINATTGGALLASGTSSGTGLGPFTAASLSTSSGLALTLNQTMAAGSTNAISHYASSLSCTNSTPGSTTAMPTNVATTSYSFGTMQFGDAIQCTYTETPYPHLLLQKALAATGRQYSTDQFVMNITQGATVIATATTSGTGATVTGGATAMTQVTPSTAYGLSEAGAGATSLTQYTATLSCTNANTSSTTTLPVTVGGAITPKMGDVVTCTITNTKKATNAFLTIVKSSSVVSDPVNGSSNPKIIPGAIILYSFTVANTGATAVDNNSVWLIDTLPSQISVGTASSPTFVQGTPTSGLTFTAGTDIKYSNSATAPASFAACTYTPVAAYDPLVKFVCLNPKGIMAGSTGTPPSFTLSIQAKVN